MVNVNVKLDIQSYDKLEEYSKIECDGVGLLKGELLVDSLDSDEIIRVLSEKLENVALKFKDKPIWYKPLDNNSMLKAEFKAIKNLYERGITNIGILLPLVINIDEIKKAKSLLREVGLEPLDEIEFGVMIETPASSFIIENIIKEGIDFINFGLDNLTKSTLFLDKKSLELYDESHPAVLNQIKGVIKVCKGYNIETCLSGLREGHIELIEFLVKSGIDSISCSKECMVNTLGIMAKK